MFIENLRISCLIGVEKTERSRPQTLFADIVLLTDTSRAAGSDSISQAIDYEPLTNRILQSASRSRFKLIESLAEQLASLCLENSKAESVTITIRKPSALRDASCAGVEITRCRK